MMSITLPAGSRSVFGWAGTLIDIIQERAVEKFLAMLDIAAGTLLPKQEAPAPAGITEGM